MGVQAYRDPYRLSLHIPSAHFTFRFLLDSIDSADYFRLNSSRVNFHCLIILVTFRFLRTSLVISEFCFASAIVKYTNGHSVTTRRYDSNLASFFRLFFFLFLVLILAVILNLSPLQLPSTLTNAPSILN